jgi:hypothetical protein
LTRTSFTIRDDHDRRHIAEMVGSLKNGMRVLIKDPKRTDAQNDKFWAMLGEIAEQVKWHGLLLSEDDWKLIFIDALKREVRIVPNIDGNGFVNLNTSSSDLSVNEMSDAIELMYAFGANHGVKFRDSSDEPQANTDRTNTPAAHPGPQPAAGVPSFAEASLLSDDWRDTYIVALSGVRDKAASLKTRHDEAMQMVGGKPNEPEKAWMRLVYGLVQRRDTGRLNQNENFADEIEKLKTMPLPTVEIAA